jgi:predicted N-acyltransferase
VSKADSSSGSLTVSVLRGLGEVAAAEWDAIAGPDDPFAEHAFLDLLERSGSVGPGTGWMPRHVVVRRDGVLIGAVAAYRKDDSWGEFVFDFHWARAAAQAQIRYFPKLVAMAPFTPATGRRLLVAPGEDRAAIVAALVRGLHEAADELGASSIHALYLNEEERAEMLSAPGFMPRLSVQFHFLNEGYRSFDDLLARMRSPARKQIRRERREVAESGLRVEVKEGPTLDDRDWHALEIFYRLNAARHGAFGYLTPEFFPLLRARFAHRVVAVLAYDGAEPIAGSLNFEKGDVLYGRYWGTSEDVEFLHFECCYHRLIERAIEKGHRRVEAGAQGLHKIKRGLLPSDVHSAHWIRDPRLRRAIAEFLPEEARAVRAEAAELAGSGPFRRDGDGPER